MHGGLAYVLDENGEFSGTQCNHGDVDLMPLDPQDLDSLRYWIARHTEETRSPRGNWILENWNAIAPKFVKVFPREYQRVLGVAHGKALAHG